MADKEKKDGGKFTSNKKGKLDSLAGNEGISRALNMATKVAFLAVAVIIVWKFFEGRPKAAVPPPAKQVVAEKKATAPEFPPIVVRCAGWERWVDFNPRTIPLNSTYYYLGPREAEVRYSSGRVGIIAAWYEHDRDGLPVAFRCPEGEKIEIILKKAF
jgi:hypothetical protein